MDNLVRICFKKCFIRCVSACTVFSVSSGYVKCGVSVIRVSGPHTKNALKALTSTNFSPKERYGHLKALYHPETKEMIDKGLVLWFPGPASFTGEDLCEFQVHGSIAVIGAMLDALSKVPGLKQAQPGEFTKRAFFGGKLDLTEVDGLADLIHAETEAQRKQALLQSNGTLSRLYLNWRKRLIRCVAHLEAYIDFAEDENIEEDTIINLKKDLIRLKIEIRKHLGDQRQGEMLRSGVRTAIIGAPNVGKSSFLNLLCQRNVSIVTNRAGTTRDIIETTHNIGGYPVIFADTAGLRKHTDDVIEKEGISRTKQCVKSADLLLLVMDVRELHQYHVNTEESLENYLKIYFQNLDIPKDMIASKHIQLVANKIDLLDDLELVKLESLSNVCLISCQTQQNLSNFLINFTHQLQQICGTPAAEHPRITQERYRQQLERCIEHISIFLEEYTPDENADMAIAAQKLRNAVRCIERITGHISTEDILSVVFKDFCIGK